MLIFNIGPTQAVRAQPQLQRVTNNTQFFEYIENFNIYRLYHFLFKYTENEIKVQSDSKPQIEANLNCHSWQISKHSVQGFANKRKNRQI